MSNIYPLSFVTVKTGKIERRTPDNYLKEISELGWQDLAWVHLNAEEDGTEIILDELEIPQKARTALLSSETGPSFSLFPKGKIIFLRGLDKTGNAPDEEMVSLKIWISGSTIITVRHEKIMAIDEILEAMNTGNPITSCGEIVFHIISYLNRNIESYIEIMEETIDGFEETIGAENAAGMRNSLSSLYRRIIFMRRYMIPQRDLLQIIHGENILELNQEYLMMLEEKVNEGKRHIEDLILLRERAELIKGDINILVSEKMNGTIYILSIIGSIFLPLSFLTGLFGVNLAGIPMASASTSFAMFFLLLIFLGIVEYLIFKKNRWL